MLCPGRGELRKTMRTFPPIVKRRRLRIVLFMIVFVGFPYFLLGQFLFRKGFGSSWIVNGAIAVTILVVLSPGLSASTRRLEKRIRNGEICGNCGYDLTGHDRHGICSECGTRFTSKFASVPKGFLSRR